MTIEFTLPAELEAHDPPEARGTPRDGVRMLVSRGTTGQISHHRFTGLPELLRPGDLIGIHTSGPQPAPPPPPAPPGAAARLGHCDHTPPPAPAARPAAVPAVAAPGLAVDGPGLAVHFSG